MKNSNKIVLFIAMLGIMLASTLVSCEKTSTEDPSGGGSGDGKITDGTWKLFYSMGTTPAGTYDVYGHSKPCEKDDFLKFTEDFKWIMDEGPTKCSSSDPQEEIGTYGFTSNKDTLIIYDQGDTMYLSIVSLTSDVLVLEYTDYDSLMQWDISGVMKYEH